MWLDVKHPDKNNVTMFRLNVERGLIEYQERRVRYIVEFATGSIIQVIQPSQNTPQQLPKAS